MPIGGSNIGWDNTTPADTENAGSGDDRIRSLKTSVQEALDNEHNFPIGGGANTGYHRLGSGRVLASNTTRLFYVGANVAFLGGEGAVNVDGTSYDGWPVTSRWALEFGTDTVNGVGRVQVTFPNSGFSGVPFVFANVRRAPAAADVSIVIDAVTASTFSAYVAVNTLAGNGETITWFSIGTRTTGLT
mgnify:CR=1 FL=1